MSRKRGALSLDEQNFIISNVHEQSTQEIAEVLNRTAGTIEKFIKKNDLRGKVAPDEQYEILLSKLRHRPYYQETVNQLTETELTYFEQNWVNLMLQFRENVLYSEELSLKQLIILDILMNRSMIERRAHQEDATRLQTMLDTALNAEVRDEQFILSIETQLSFARTSITAYTNEHTKLLKERRDIDKSLKTTREQRIQRVEDGKSSFTDWLRSLEEEDERALWGQYAELMRMSMYKARDRLSENHVYEDDKVDLPYLTVESARNAE